MNEDTLLERITVDPNIFEGKPIIRGRSLAVEHVLGMLAAGDSPDTILSGYPWLESEDIHACLLYARKSLRAFLMQQLRLIEADRQARCAKVGATDLWDMERLMVEGKVEEEQILEDFQTVDYLTGRIKRIKAMLEQV